MSSVTVKHRSHFSLHQFPTNPLTTWALGTAAVLRFFLQHLHLFQFILRICWLSLYWFHFCYTVNTCVLQTYIAYILYCSASEMTYIVSGGPLNSTHSRCYCTTHHLVVGENGSRFLLLRFLLRTFVFVISFEPLFRRSSHIVRFSPLFPADDGDGTVGRTLVICLRSTGVCQLNSCNGITNHQLIAINLYHSISYKTSMKATA